MSDSLCIKNECIKCCHNDSNCISVCNKVIIKVDSNNLIEINDDETEKIKDVKIKKIKTEELNSETNSTNN